LPLTNAIVCHRLRAHSTGHPVFCFCCYRNCSSLLPLKFYVQKSQCTPELWKIVHSWLYLEFCFIIFHKAFELAIFIEIAFIQISGHPCYQRNCPARHPLRAMKKGGRSAVSQSTRLPTCIAAKPTWTLETDECTFWNAFWHRDVLDEKIQVCVKWDLLFFSYECADDN